MNTQKKMYKVLVPLDKKGGGTYWMRLGSAFTNRDDSINLYLDAVPPTDPKTNRYHLQIRELTEEDLRRRDSYGSGGGGGGSNGFGGSGGAAMLGGPGGAGGSGTHSSVAEAPSSYVRDLGGIGGGPTTRAVTAHGTNEEGVPF